MSKFAVFATFYVDVSQKEDFLSAMKAHAVRCVRDEPDTLIFDVLTTEDHEDVVYLYEVYTDKAAFDTHFNGEYIKELLVKIEGMMTKEFSFIELALQDD